MPHSYVQELEELIKTELLPVYLKYYRLLNAANTLSSGQKDLINEIYKDPKLCRLVQPQKSNVDLQRKP